MCKVCVFVFNSHRSQMKKPLFVPNYTRLDMDSLGSNLEDKLKDFLREVRSHVNDAIDSLCEYTHTHTHTHTMKSLLSDTQTPKVIRSGRRT